jgi:hypothetical protein
MDYIGIHHSSEIFLDPARHRAVETLQGSDLLHRSYPDLLNGSKMFKQCPAPCGSYTDDSVQTAEKIILAPSLPVGSQREPVRFIP